jgi:hypothetical protein
MRAGGRRRPCKPGGGTEAGGRGHLRGWRQRGAGWPAQAHCGHQRSGTHQGNSTIPDSLLSSILDNPIVMCNFSLTMFDQIRIPGHLKSVLPHPQD